MTAGARGAAGTAALFVAAGAFGIYQTGSPLFDCGRTGVGVSLHFWLGVAAFQSLLFMVASGAATRLYRLSQWAMLGIAVATLVQLGAAYPRTAAVLVAVAAVHLVLSRGSPGGLWQRAADFVRFAVVAGVTHTALAFVVMNVPGWRLGDAAFGVLLVLSLAFAAWVLRRTPMPAAAIGIADLPPFSILCIALLRAKLPDGAYDALFYKATLPALMADWRTAITGAIDHTLLGTNFLEFLNAQLRILDPGYAPALLSSLAFAGLWLVAPLAGRAVAAAAPGAAGFVARATALLVVSLTEPMTASGTSYHEPMMALLLALSLLRGPVAFIALAAAIASKVTIVFIVPVILTLRWAQLPGDGVPKGWRARIAAEALPSRAVLAACVAVAMIAAGGQFVRNLHQTARVMGVSELGASITDPEGAVLSRGGFFSLDAAARGLGLTERYGNTLVHVLTLDRILPVHEQRFHVLPASRMIALAVPLCLVLLLWPSLRKRSPAASWAAAAWLVAFVAMPQFFVQGRHLFPLSFAAAAIAPLLAATFAGPAMASSRWALALAVAVAFAAVGDQWVGTRIHTGWDCRRPLVRAIEHEDVALRATPLERRLGGIVDAYRAKAPATSVVPSIACEPYVERMHYLGAHYVFAIASLAMQQRRIWPDGSRERLVPQGLLAVCFRDPAWLDILLPDSQRDAYEELPPEGNVRILVSRALAQGAPASSLALASPPPFEPRPLAPGALASPPRVSSDLVADWQLAGIAPERPVDTPSGRGAFRGELDGAPVGVLLSPYTVTFDDAQLHPGRSLVLSLAMPFHASDGMQLILTLLDLQGRRRTLMIDLPARPGPDAPLAWKEARIAVPDDFQPRGQVTIRALSLSGNANGDWAYIRSAVWQPRNPQDRASGR
jgi:hypothetical protein